MIAETLTHYRLVEKIGEGGMGVVYRARDERLDRDVAIKVLPTGTLADDTARKRFRKEALALAKLSHPNIGVIHDFDTQEGVDFLVMEYIAGATLAERLRAGALPEKEALAVGAQIVAALEEAHEHGVVHRDLKPGNILVTPKGQAKVLDFGLAKLLRPESEISTTDELSSTAALAGTMPYMSPERLRGEPADARSDIYGAGAVLYEMATGQRAFRETLATQLTDAILHQPPVPPRAVNARVSPELERIILKCLDKEPENRYQSAKELSVDLRRLVSPSAVLPVAAPHRFAQHYGRYAIMAACLAVVLIAGVLVGSNVGGARDRLLGRTAPPRIESLAVLPLENLSHDPEQEYFADGMTEALITNLAQISSLRVISRSSAMRYKGVRKPLPEIAKELNVDAVVEGSVAHFGNRVRIDAQLIQAPTDRHLWARSYERDLSDILVLERDLARAIAAEIQIKVTSQERQRLANARPVDPEAQEDYLKGLYYWGRRPLGLQKGIAFFQQALEKEPTYALPYSGLALSYATIGSWENGMLPPREAMPKAKAAGLRALELDDTLSQAHAALAYVQLHYDWDWAGAQKEFQRAIELNPSDSTAHHWYSHYLTAAGRNEESLAESRRAQQLDPLDPVISIHLAWLYQYAHQYDKVIEQSNKVLEAIPQSFWPHFNLGLAYEQKSMFDKAIAEFQKTRALSPASTFGTAGLGHAYATAGKRVAAKQILRELIEQSKKAYVPAFDVSVVYMGMGDDEHAFEWLEKAYAERSTWLVYLKRDPRFDSLHTDPRFQDHNTPIYLLGIGR